MTDNTPKTGSGWARLRLWSGWAVFGIALPFVATLDGVQSFFCNNMGQLCPPARPPGIAPASPPEIRRPSPQTPMHSDAPSHTTMPTVIPSEALETTPPPVIDSTPPAATPLQSGHRRPADTSPSTNAVPAADIDAPPLQAEAAPSETHSGNGAPPACQSKIVDWAGATGPVTDALTHAGNEICVQAPNRGQMMILMELCGGERRSVSAIEIERRAYRGLRKTGSVGEFAYTLIDSGVESLPQSMHGGPGGAHKAYFAPTLATHVRILVHVPTPRLSRDVPAVQQVCSITVY